MLTDDELSTIDSEASRSALKAQYELTGFGSSTSHEVRMAGLRAVAAEVARKTLEVLDIRAHTAAGYVRITDCPECQQLVQVERRTGEFVGHDISPLLRAVCPGSARAASISTGKAGTGE